MTMANTLNYLKVSLFRTTNTMLITFRITFSSFTTSRSVIRSFNIFSFHNHWERFLESGIVKKYALCFFSLPRYQFISLRDQDLNQKVKMISGCRETDPDLVRRLSGQPSPGTSGRVAPRGCGGRRGALVSSGTSGG